MLRKEGYREKCDIFSLGSILFNLLAGRYLFNGANNEETLEKNRECEYSRAVHYLTKHSPEARDIIFKMLEANPNKRLSAEEALSHPWFSDNSQIINDLIRVNDHICTRYLRGLNNLKSSFVPPQAKTAEEKKDSDVASPDR
jgi:serine/threonine protein kinase